MKEKASDIVFNIIKEKLITGEWYRDSKIMTEVEIARQTGISRTSVREAIERMVSMGILVRRRGDGTYVRDISPQILMTRLQVDRQKPLYDFIEVLDFREMVEPEAVKRMIRLGDHENLQVMIASLDEMQRYADLKMSDEFAQADTQFHFALLRGGHNSILDKAINIIQESLICYQYGANQLIGAKTGVEEHAAIINTICQKDEEMAALLVKRHIQRSKKDLVAYWKRQTGKEDKA